MLSLLSRQVHDVPVACRIVLLAYALDPVSFEQSCLAQHDAMANSLVGSSQDGTSSAPQAHICLLQLSPHASLQAPSGSPCLFRALISIRQLSCWGPARCALRLYMFPRPSWSNSCPGQAASAPPCKFFELDLHLILQKYACCGYFNDGHSWQGPVCKTSELS